MTQISPRIWRSPQSDYYSDEILKADEVYDDAYLHAMGGHRLDGIWLRAILRDVAGSQVFPELGGDAAVHQRALNRLCRRAASYGIKIYLYLDEPLAFPRDDGFWARHPELRGQSGSSGMDNWDATYALCTSQPQVREFLRQATHNLFLACPQLAGLILITRSEHHSHCYSHHDSTDCPRCSKRALSEVVAEVINSIAAGAHSAKASADVIAWNWSWPAGDSEQIVQKLDATVILMGDFERGGRKLINGKSRFIDEYSLSYVGPSPRFGQLAAAASARGMRIFAKLQIGTTHEIATVNNLPLIPNLLGKVRAMRKYGVTGTLATWNFGNRLSLNTYAFGRFVESEEQDDRSLLQAVAREYLGTDHTDGVLKAWEQFVEAFDHFPFCVSVLYHAPTNYVLAYPFPTAGDPPRPMQKSWVPLTRPFGTDLMQAVCGWRGPDFSRETEIYTLDEICEGIERTANGFAAGMATYQRALGGSCHPQAVRELHNARIIGHILRSLRNTFMAYREIHQSPPLLDQWRQWAEDEIANLQEVLPHLRGEKEIGFHIEAQDWYFTEATVREKHQLLQRLVEETASLPGRGDRPRQ